VREEDVQMKDLNIIITNDTYIKELNKKFLKRNRPTNVLSFDLGEIAEIYISYDRVDSTHDLFYYIIHGLLHIMGYDHNNKTEEEIMKNKCMHYLEPFSRKEQ
jgi:probable rRNA maturation factor